MAHRPVTLAALLALASPSFAQIFTDSSATNIPQVSFQSSHTEQIDFADVDLDGDFDAALARGADFGNLQDRLWINQGGMQGGTIGVFVDETTTRFPVLARTGRDVDFVDFDGDGDLDLYGSNVSTITNQACHWWTNLGGLQGGTVGFFANETAMRWVGLGGPGSSIAPSTILPDGFITWAGDADFADLDNDGDLDLVHATYGGAFGGQNPSRMFLNDSLGFFSEFNPSGYQLPGTALPPGSPGLWCEGTFQNNTTDTTGAFCDITNNGVDIELGDIDGDFDIDLLHGGRDFLPRYFGNRLEENGGAPGDLGFRDLTNAVFDPGYATNGGNYDQELGDFDGDNDLDFYGLDWGAGGFSFDDVTFENVAGEFENRTVIPGTNNDGEEIDWGDYDNDGDLDIFIAGFSGGDKLYANDGTGALTEILPATSGLDGSNTTAYDCEWGDLDEDGDYDVIVAKGFNNVHILYENATNVADTTAPRVGPVEDVGDQTAGLFGSDDVPVRTHVYDNAAYYLTWYNPTDLLLWADGIPIDTIPAMSSGGQVFRAEIPSNLVGEITYAFRSRDAYGNTGISAPVVYDATSTLVPSIEYGTGTTGSTGMLHQVVAHSLGTPGKPLYLSVQTNGVPTVFALDLALGSIAPTPIPGLGTVNIDPGTILKTIIGVTNAFGYRVFEFSPGADLATAVPFSTFWQVFAADGVGGDTFSSTLGVEIPFQ